MGEKSRKYKWLFVLGIFIFFGFVILIFSIEKTSLRSPTGTPFIVESNIQHLIRDFQSIDEMNLNDIPDVTVINLDDDSLMLIHFQEPKKELRLLQDGIWYRFKLDTMIAASKL